MYITIAIYTIVLINASVAGKPENVDGTATYNTITMTWDPPLISGGQIIGYRLTVKNVSTVNDELCSQERLLLCNTCTKPV